MTDLMKNKNNIKDDQMVISIEAIINNLHDSICAVSKNLRWIAANTTFKRNFLDAFGITVIKGKSVREGIPKEFLNFWEIHYYRGLAGETYSFEFEQVVKGKKRTFDISVSPIYLAEGEIYGITIISKEITQQKTIENKLSNTQSAFSEALLFSKMGYWELKLSTFQLSLSKYKQIMLEMESVSEMPIYLSLNDYAQQYVFPEDLPIIQNNLALLIENKGNINYSLQFDYRCITTKKSVKYFHLRCEVRENDLVYGFTQDITEQKLAEIELAESQILYENLVETLPDMVLLHRNGTILFANQTLYETMGLTKEIIGKSILDFDLPEHVEETKEILIKRQRGEKIPDYEIKLPKKDGKMMQLRVKSTDIYIQQQLTTLIIFEDITYLNESQEKLQKNNDVLISVINSPNQTIIYSLDTHYCYTSFNEKHKNTMKHLWACDIEIGGNILTYIKNEEEKHKLKEYFDMALAGENFQITEEYDEFPNRFFYENTYTPIKDSKGNITGITVFLFDVSSLKRTEEALVKSQKEINIIFENSFDAVFLIDEASYKIIRCNKRAVALFEVENKQTITHTLGYEHFMPEGINHAELTAVLNEGQIWQEEVEYVSAKGTIFWGHLSIKKLSSLSEMGFLMMKIVDISQRKFAERKLFEKQKQLEAIIENTSDYIWLIDTDYRLLNANSSFRNSILERQGVIISEGDSLIDDIPHSSTEDLPRWKKWYDRALSGIAFVKENSNIVNNEVFYWENFLYPVKEDDRITGVAILSRNITARKRKEEQIRQTAEQLKYAIAATKEGVWDWDIKNKRFSNNQAWYDLLKYEPHQITHTTEDISSLMVPDDKEYVQNIIWATRRGELNTFECEYRIINKKGEFMWIRDRGSVVEKDLNGQATRMVGTLENITERKLIELELQAQQKFIEKVINAVPNLIFVKDSQGKFMLVNTAFAAFYNTEVQNLIGKSDAEILVNKEYLNYYDASDQQVLATEQPIYLPETQLIDPKTGETSFYQTVKVLLAGIDGEKQILGVATNITERKKAEAEKVKLLESLMQNVQDLEQFTYMVSHNLRSHVARILGLSALLDKETKDNPFNDYIFSTIVDEATRLDTIIGDLNIILAVRNSNEEKREEINLRQIADSVLLSLKIDVEKSGANMTVDIPADFHIYAIKTYSYSVILNLLSNAIKYRSPERVLNIGIKAFKTSDQKFIGLSVQDNGLGINLSKNKDKVFGLYRRFHSHVEGKGIGLHITKTQIERMGGSIEIESELNIGTKFNVYFPV